MSAPRRRGSEGGAWAEPAARGGRRRGQARDAMRARGGMRARGAVAAPRCGGGRRPARPARRPGVPVTRPVAAHRASSAAVESTAPESEGNDGARPGCRRLGSVPDRWIGGHPDRRRRGGARPWDGGTGVAAQRTGAAMHHPWRHAAGGGMRPVAAASLQVLPGRLRSPACIPGVAPGFRGGQAPRAAHAIPRLPLARGGAVLPEQPRTDRCTRRSPDGRPRNTTTDEPGSWPWVRR